MRFKLGASSLYLKKIVFISVNSQNTSWRLPKALYGLIFSIIPLFSGAQEYALSGKVIGLDNVSIPYADVVLQDKNDVVIKWATTDNGGRYTIENIAPASYILKVSIFGYATKAIEVEIDKDVLEHTTVLEQEAVALNEVVIRNPRIENRADGIVFNVENTTLSNGDTWNVLTRTPYLFETGNQILVRGTEVPTIFINDRRVYLSSEELKQLLENTPANLLKSVEVILTPSAKYDADGKTIVNIVMSKNLSIGYNGRVGVGYEQGVYPKYNLNTGHFYKKNAINMYAGYSYRWKKTYVLSRGDTNFIIDDMPVGSWNYESLEDATRSIHDFNTNIDYKINDNHDLNFSGNASIIPDKKEFTGSLTEAIDSSFYSENRTNYTRDRVILSLDYKYDIGNGKKLTANIHHTNYGSDQKQNIVTDYFDADQIITRNNAFINNIAQDVKVYTAQIDYASSDKNRGIEMGIKAAHIGFNSQIIQRNVVGNNLEFSDFLVYDENNLAAYISHEKNWEHWNIRLGIRGENTNLKGVSVLDNEVNTQDYFKLFPSILLGYRPSEGHRFTLSYNKKIDRPQFGKLNPFRLFENDNSYVEGNPNLLPAINHRFEFNYRIKNTIGIEFYFYRLKNPILQLIYVNNEERQIIFRNDNLDRNIVYGGSFQWNKTINSWWDITTYSHLYHNTSYFFANQSTTEVFNLSRWAVYQRISNYFNFSKTFTGEVGFRFNSKSIVGNYTKGVQQDFHVGLQKTLWNKKAILSFNAYDIFNQLSPTNELRYADQSMTSYLNPEARTFEINFTYKFGNYKLRTNRKGIFNEERDRL